MKKRIKTSQLFRALIIICVLAIGMGFTLPYLNLEISKFKCIVGAMVPMLVVLGYCMFSLREKIVLTLLVLLGVWIPFIIWAKSIISEEGSRLTANQVYLLLLEEYREIYVWILLAAFSLLLCLLGVLLDRFVILRRLFCGVVAIYLVICMVGKMEVSQVSIAVSVFYFLLCYVEYQHHNYGKTSVVWLVPFLGIYLCLLCIIPADKPVYQWQFVRNIWEQMEVKRIQFSQSFGRRSGEGFSMRFSGFSESGEVGGDITFRDSEDMGIRMHHKWNGNLYLSGQVYDSFSGKEWKYTGSQEEYPYEMDVIETLYAVHQYAPEHVEHYLKWNGMLVRFEELKSRYLFSPVKTRLVTMKSDKENVLWSEGSFLFSKKKGYGTGYESYFLQLNLGHSSMYQLIEEVYQIQETGMTKEDMELWDKLYAEYAGSTSLENGEDSIKKYRDSIKEQYGKTDKISAEAAKYLEQITKECETKLEMILAIEKELQGYTYTTTPGTLPKEIENDVMAFMDYFLLDTKEGYCTYFATAFVILARNIGLPARYVQGYCVPITASGKEDTKVSASMAHAWPEVYFEGIGFIPFEPTPGFETVRYQPWKIQDTEENDLAEPLTNQEHNRENREEMMEEESVPIEMTVEIEKETVPLRWIVLLILLFLFGTWLVIFVDVLLRKYRYCQLKTEEQIMETMVMNMRLLGYLGFALGEGETLEELKNRMILSDTLSDVSFDFIDSFENMRYGNVTGDQSVLQKMYTEQNLLMNHLKEKRRFLYLWLKKTTQFNFNKFN